MNFKTLFTDEALFLDSVLKDGGINMRMVGGAVRDAILGITPKDLDFAVDHPPERVMEVLVGAGVHVIPTGLQHGTITAVVNGEPFELTTLRVDVETDGRHAEVEWTSDFEMDASRRDFTINAMSVDSDGNLFDYFDGVEDLKNKVVRFIGNPDDRINEDFLRILRFFRFNQRLDNLTASPEMNDQIEAIRRNVSKINTISGERIWMEFSKILSGKNVVWTLDLMAETGIFSAIGIPGFHVNSNIYDVSNRTGNPVTILAAGFSNKTDTDVALDTMTHWWKVTANERELFRFISGHTSSRKHRKMTFWDEYLKLLSVKPKANDEFIHELAFFVGSDLFDHWDTPIFPVRGQDLIDVGVRPGKEVGVLLNKMHEDWVISKFTLDRSDLLEMCGVK